MLEPVVDEPPRRILLDTDLAMGVPGTDIDDGFALALAVADPALRLELVTTVGGNTDVATSTRLTHDLLRTLGRTDIEVVRGAPAGDDAARAIARRVMAEPGELTLVAIGPLTNLARALALEPGLAGALAEIVVMGGVFLEEAKAAAGPAEHNFRSDPEAVRAVCGSGAPLRFVGLDVTLRVRLSRADARALARAGDFGRIAAEQAQAWISHLAGEAPWGQPEEDGCALHDPLAVAVVAHPELCIWRPVQLTVQTEPGSARGVAVADPLTRDDASVPSCRIATDVDAEAFRRLFTAAMATLP